MALILGLGTGLALMIALLVLVGVALALIVGVVLPDIGEGTARLIISPPLDDVPFCNFKKHKRILI